MKISLLKTYSILFTALAFAACSKKQEAAPAPAPTAAAPAQPAVTAPPPSQAAAPAPVPPPAAPGYEGEWNGDSGPNLPLSFTVEGNQVTSSNANYAGQKGSCSYNGGIGSEGPAPINGNSFVSKGKNDFHGSTEYVMTGTFTSPTEASGTVAWKGKSELCGEYSMEYNWKAKKGPPADSGAGMPE